MKNVFSIKRITTNKKSSGRPTSGYLIPLSILFVSTLLLQACSGGGSGVAIPASGGGGGTSGSGSSGGGATNQSFPPSSSLAAICETPRPDTTDVDGLATDENNWLRSWSNELYLWYDEIIDQDPALFNTPDYFNLMKTNATTSSGAQKDRFHFSRSTEEWENFSESGVIAGYGLGLVFLQSLPPRELAVGYVEPLSPATSPTDGIAIERGSRILEIDGVDLVNADSNADVDTLNEGLFPSNVGDTHAFLIRNPNGSLRTVTLTAIEVTTKPVLQTSVINTATGNVGYMVFNDHIATAEQQLFDAIQTFANANVTDLILDLRYNGGGLLALASELGFMIAGTNTDGLTFENLVFNDKNPDTDPVNGSPLQPIPFYNTASGQLSVAVNTTFPTLNLPSVYILASQGTCSASESIINSLIGIGVDVYLFGDRTCGKPYGFYPTDNCGTTYFSIQFRGENAAGFGDYADGFAPQNADLPGTIALPGCAVADDFDSALGDPSEGMLAAALQYRVSGVCPPVPSASSASTSSDSITKARVFAGNKIELQKPVWRNNRIMLPTSPQPGSAQ